MISKNIFIILLAGCVFPLHLAHSGPTIIGTEKIVGAQKIKSPQQTKPVIKACPEGQLKFSGTCRDENFFLSLLRKNQSLVSVTACAYEPCDGKPAILTETYGNGWRTVVLEPKESVLAAGNLTAHKIGTKTSKRDVVQQPERGGFKVSGKIVTKVEYVGDHKTSTKITSYRWNDTSNQMSLMGSEERVSNSVTGVVNTTTCGEDGECVFGTLYPSGSGTEIASCEERAAAEGSKVKLACELGDLSASAVGGIAAELVVIAGCTAFGTAATEAAVAGGALAGGPVGAGGGAAAGSMATLGCYGKGTVAVVGGTVSVATLGLALCGSLGEFVEKTMIENNCGDTGCTYNEGVQYINDSGKTCTADEKRCPGKPVEKMADTCGS